jgi:two-component system cell cycle sensor histidine kinase/response regulator CckA
MSKKLRILLVDDSAADAELVAHALKAGEIPCTIQHVQSEEAFVQALKEVLPDLILADYSLPDFEGSQALRLAQEHQCDAPFILVSGTVGEEKVVELIRQGATDYVPKGNLGKLLPAIQRALREVEHRNQKRRVEVSLRDSESRFRAIFEGAGAGIAVEDLTGKIVESNRALQQMLGYTAEELQRISRREFTHSRDHQEDRRQYQRLAFWRIRIFPGGEALSSAGTAASFGAASRFRMVRDTANQPQFSLAMIEDITERQRAEESAPPIRRHRGTFPRCHHQRHL